MPFVQAKDFSSDSTSGTTAAITFSAAVTSGNSVAGVVSWSSGVTTTLSGIADNQSNTYTIQRRILDSTNGQCLASFYRINITNAPTTITATFSPSLSWRALSVVEMSGFSTLDKETGQWQTAPGTGANAVTSGAVTPVSNGQYIYGGSVATDIGATGSSLYAAGTGFTERAELLTSGLLPIASEDQIQTTAASIAGWWTAASASMKISFVMTFVAAGGAADNIYLTNQGITLQAVNRGATF